MSIKKEEHNNILQRLQFVINDTAIDEVLNPSLTVLDYLRYSKGLVGTKIGCREGDCGACTVLVGELTEEGRIRYRSVTSCLTPMANIHHRHLVTIEGLCTDSLSKVQQAMVDASGTQCGICTPGFIVSMTGFVLGDNPQKGNVIDAVDGNICRCTGYKSIERAAAIIEEALLDLSSDYGMDDLVNHQFIPEYFKGIRTILASFEEDTIPPDPYHHIIGGGTDLFVHHADALLTRHGNFIRKPLIGHPIQMEEDWVIMEKHATATDLMEFTPLTEAIPQWVQFMKLISSTPIRNIGTIAGNIVNASPIGDFSILLLALEARLVIRSEQGLDRTIPLNEFYIAYKKFDLAKGEYLHQIKCRIPSKSDYFHFDKVCKRQYLDIATVNTAISLSIEEFIIRRAVVSIGGVGPIPMYLARTSAFILGKTLTTDTILGAIDILQSEISPISDVRGSQLYKRKLATHLFAGHFTPFFEEQELMSLIQS